MINYSAIRKKLADVMHQDVNTIQMIPPGENSDVTIITIPSWCDTAWKVLILGIHELLYPMYPADDSEFSIDFKSEFIKPLTQQLIRKLRLDVETMRLMSKAGLDRKLYPEFLRCHYTQNSENISDPVELKAMNECITLRIQFAEEHLAGNSPKPGNYAFKLHEALQTSQV